MDHSDPAWNHRSMGWLYSSSTAVASLLTSEVAPACGEGEKPKRCVTGWGSSSAAACGQNPTNCDRRQEV